MDPETILQFWFGGALENREAMDERCKLWFGSNPYFDEQIRQRFGHLPYLAAEARCPAWISSPRSCLALALILDQFPRNLYRGQGRAFAFDRRAVECARTAIGFGFDRKVHPVEAAFFYLPLEHAENSSLQDLSVEKFRLLRKRAPRHLLTIFNGFYAYALAHRAVIRRFGRFPHRNAMLGRTSGPEEMEYLAQGGETFGSGRSAGAKGKRSATINY
ncbi:MAG: DUF924 family protein [Syntrophotaleaceae bacterium]